MFNNFLIFSFILVSFHKYPMHCRPPRIKGPFELKNEVEWKLAQFHLRSMRSFFLQYQNFTNCVC
uniref:Uncharacterized protein n=1 Tax=Anguilla anguilla TaxID=7936 RepID=A0A0E9XZ74_ANGAN